MLLGIWMNMFSGTNKVTWPESCVCVCVLQVIRRYSDFDILNSSLMVSSTFFCPKSHKNECLTDVLQTLYKQQTCFILLSFIIYHEILLFYSLENTRLRSLFPHSSSFFANLLPSWWGKFSDGSLRHPQGFAVSVSQKPRLLLWESSHCLCPVQLLFLDLTLRSESDLWGCWRRCSDLLTALCCRTQCGNIQSHHHQQVEVLPNRGADCRVLAKSVIVYVDHWAKKELLKQQLSPPPTLFTDQSLLELTTAVLLLLCSPHTRRLRKDSERLSAHI